MRLLDSRAGEVLKRAGKAYINGGLSENGEQSLYALRIRNSRTNIKAIIP